MLCQVIHHHQPLRHHSKALTLYPYFKNRIVYVDDLAEGIYLVTMREEDKVSSKKVIVQR
ncbi:MAG TPA: T9SS type A sorting domain-containing protein [Chitinophagales bacterium]|nr:T9SS type A sorting domain-containing protein [Chitinophagales bacterium]